MMIHHARQCELASSCVYLMIEVANVNIINIGSDAADSNKRWWDRNENSPILLMQLSKMRPLRGRKSRGKQVPALIGHHIYFISRSSSKERMDCQRWGYRTVGEDIVASKSETRAPTQAMKTEEH
jgi:hypothetical protein